MLSISLGAATHWGVFRRRRRRACCAADRSADRYGEGSSRAGRCVRGGRPACQHGRVWLLIVRRHTSTPLPQGPFAHSAPVHLRTVHHCRRRRPAYCPRTGPHGGFPHYLIVVHLYTTAAAAEDAECTQLPGTPQANSHATSVRPGRRTQRQACTGTPVHYKQSVRG